jgi:hypothetical protein
MCPNPQQLQKAAATADNMQLDPALVAPGRQDEDRTDGQHGWQNGSDASAAPEEQAALRAERRTQLMREAEVMRAQLRAKEREIDDLT